MGVRFEVGQACVVKPVTFNGGTEAYPRHERGTILYIHPRLRYVLVGVDLPGGQLRECFFPDKVHLPEKKRKR